MNEFTLAFPLAVAQDNFWEWAMEKKLSALIPKDSSWMLVGNPYVFTVHIQPAHSALAQIFQEHSNLESEELKFIREHQSILFLVGRLREKSHFAQVQQAIESIINAGALGVVFEHTGAAHTAKQWLEYGSESIAPWLNWVAVKNELRSIGMEIFGLPDLQVPDSLGDSSVEIGNEIADALALDSLVLESGQSMETENGTILHAQRLPQSPWLKNHPHWNRQGSWNLTI